LLFVHQKYRKEDPSNSEETEYLENLFDALCVCLHSHAENQRKFADHDGLQLMLTMIKRQTYAKSAAFKAIDYAVQSESSSVRCAWAWLDCCCLQAMRAMCVRLRLNPSLDCCRSLSFRLSL